MILTSAVYMTWPPTPQRPSVADPLSPPERDGSDTMMNLSAPDSGRQSTAQSLEHSGLGSE